MMKGLLFSMLFLFACITTFGQGNDCVYKINEKDDFTGTYKLVTENYKFTKGMISSIPFLYFKLGRFIEKSDTLRVLYVNSSGANMYCFNQDSKIMFKCGEKIIELKFVGEVDCGESIQSYATINDEEFFLLQNNRIDKVRIYYSEGYIDFEKIDSEYFLNYLHCIL